MNPFFKVLSIALPSVVAGGLLFQSPVGHADDKNKNKNKRDDSSLVIKSKNGNSVTINGNLGLGNLDGIRALVRSRLQGARAAILSSNMPPQLRDKALARFDKVNAIVDRKLAKIDFRDLEQLGEQMEDLGEEIEGAMEGLEEEMEALAKSDPSFKRQLKALDNQFDFHLDFDDDGDDDRRGYSMPAPPTAPTPPMPPVPPVAPMAPTAPLPPTPPLPPAPPAGWSSVDVSGYDDDSFDGSDLKLRGDQRNRLREVRQQADAQIRNAKKQLDRLSEQLNAALKNDRTQTSEAIRLVEAISAQEVIIRKARVTAWLNARDLLDARQRDVLERGR
jgi:Spy/CpxP family protein refolding chaperone